MHRLYRLIFLYLLIVANIPISHSQSSLPSLTNSPAHYVSECKSFIAEKLYEPALFSCYNAYLLGNSDMGAVLYQLGRYHFFDQATSNNLKDSYQQHKGKASPAIKPLLLKIKFDSQSEYIARGSIYGSWCLEAIKSEAIKAEPSNNGNNGQVNNYKRLVIKPTGQYLQASKIMEQGKYRYSNNILSLGHPNFGNYQVTQLDANQLVLDNNQVYSRKACNQQGIKSFVQVLLNNKDLHNCEIISSYIGPQLIPVHYLPTELVQQFKQANQQNPMANQCPELTEMISNSQQPEKIQISDAPL